MIGSKADFEGVLRSAVEAGRSLQVARAGTVPGSAGTAPGADGGRVRALSRLPMCGR